MERTISFILILGVTASAVLILGGLILVFIHEYHSFDQLQTSSFTQLTSTSVIFPHTFWDIIRSIGANEGVGYITLGVLLLIVTPIFRVASSAIVFFRQRDIPIAIVTLSVLIILVGSFIGGLVLK